MRTAIYYLVPIDNDDSDATSLGAFSRSSLDVSQILRWITRFPADIHELWWPKDALRRGRAVGASRYMVSLLEVRYLSSIEPTREMPVVVVISVASTASATDAWVFRCRVKPLHVSVTPGPGRVSGASFRRSTIRKHAERTYAALNYTEDSGELRAAVGRSANRSYLSFPRTDHNTAAPNEAALFSVGMGFRQLKHIAPSTDDATAYWDAICTSADKVMELRRRSTSLDWSATPDLILASPGLRYDVLKKLLEGKALRRTPEGLQARNALIAIRDQQGYSYNSNANVLEPVARSLLAERALEMHLWTAALSVRSSSELCPVIRLPAKINNIRSHLTRFSDCYRSKGDRRDQKIRSTWQDLQREMQPWSQLLDGTLRRADSVRLVSDLPLEWLPSSHGLPLMMTHNVSRIPTLPGNVCVQGLLPQQNISLRLSAFRQVLVLRALLPNDRLYRHIEAATKFLSSMDVDCQIQDVHTRAQLERALNSFDGALVVFDGHGEHNGKHGTLVVGDERIDTWSLRGKVRVPPIVLLSACDTHPFDRTYASSATGMLACGARSVIAAMLPIESPNAAVFAFRLLHAALAMTKAILSLGQPFVRWSTIVSRTLRSQYLVEAASVVQSELKGAYTTEMMREAEIRFRLVVTAGNVHWYESALQLFAKATDRTPAAIEQLIQRKLPLPQSFLYNHLGDPESILVADPGSNH